MIEPSAGKGAIMTGDQQPPKSEARKRREERLAAELRENLRKRKTQLRARKTAASNAPAEEH
jgi:hypothetical protein